MSFDERSDALITTLEEISDSGYQYVLVGGYAVSAYNTRFSTDLDIVISSNSTGEFVEFLASHGFDEIASHTKHWTYSTKVIEYEKRLESQHPVGLDLLVNGLGCRQTEAQWSFDYLYDNSTQQEISGGTVTTIARVVDGSVLIAAKLHSGRETDIRDVLAIAEEVNLETVTPHLRRGNLDALRAQLEDGLTILDSEGLKHGFKSDFGASTVTEETVANLKRYLTSQLEQLAD